MNQAPAPALVPRRRCRKRVFGPERRNCRPRPGNGLDWGEVACPPASEAVMGESRTSFSSTGPAIPAGRHGRYVARVGFEISRTDDPALEVRERELAVSAFHVLLEFDCPGREARGTVVLPPPLSGVVSRIMRETVLALLPRYRVLVPDWINPRFIPLREGSFGLDANIAAIIG